MGALSLSTVRWTQVQCTEYSTECTVLKHSLLYLRTVKKPTALFFINLTQINFWELSILIRRTSLSLVYWYRPTKTGRRNKVNFSYHD